MPMHAFEADINQDNKAWCSQTWVLVVVFFVTASWQMCHMGMQTCSTVSYPWTCLQYGLIWEKVSQIAHLDWVVSWTSCLGAAQWGLDRVVQLCCVLGGVSLNALVRALFAMQCRGVSDTVDCQTLSSCSSYTNPHHLREIGIDRFKRDYN